MKRKELGIHREQELHAQGYMCIAGLDEAGRGAWAGPIVAGAAIMPIDVLIPSVQDSKTILPKRRAELAHRIREQAVAWAVGIVEHSEIDSIGIGPANRLAMVRAVQQLAVPPDYLLIDAWRIAELAAFPQQSIIRGDASVYSIAAASILAKVARDDMMKAYDETFPAYGFAAHKGYGTLEHRAALERHGLSSIHRRSFQPMSTMIY